jgi:hypothetical protein
MSDNSFSRPRVQLSRQNFLEWTRDWALCLPSYGTAGDEVAKQKETIEFLHKPIIGDMMWQMEENFAGDEVWVQVPMNEYHKRQVPSRLTAWKSEYEKYRKARGVLINNLINSIDESLKITIMNQPTYPELTSKSDSVGLWKLITHVMQSQGASQQDLINQWNNLRQINPSSGHLEDIQIHINKFEQILININTEANGITDRRKAEQLIKSISLSRYESIIGHWILMIEQPEDPTNPFPKYNVVKDKIMKYDEILSKSDKISKPSSTTVMNGFTTISYDNNFSYPDSNVTCLNCGRRGHVRRECTNQPVKCTRPGCRQWHPTQFHDKLATKYDPMSHPMIKTFYPGRGFVQPSRGAARNLNYSSTGGKEIGVGEKSSSQYTTSNSKQGKVFKKPTNIKAKMLDVQAPKKVYFTYTDEEGNCIDNTVYEEIQDEDQIHENIEFDDIPEDEQI